MAELYADFASTGIVLQKFRPGSHKTLCPRCSASRKNPHDHCLSVTVHTSHDVVWNCHNCAWTGGTMKKRNAPMEKASVTVRPDIVPTEPTPELLAWFQNRGIGEEIVRRMKIFQTTRLFNGREQKAIAFPYYRNGTLISVKYRSMETKAFATEANCEQAFYNVDAIVAYEEIIIVEGEMDALAMMQANFLNVISVPRGAPQRVGPGVPPPEEDTNFRYLWPAYEALRHRKRIIIATDSDDPGHALAEELARRIGKDKCWRVSWPDGMDGQCKDANEVLLLQGSGNIAASVLQAAPWPIDGVFEASAFFDATLQLYRSGRSRGYSTGWPELDEFMTIRPGEVSIVTGIPNHGKSAFIDALTHNLALSLNWKFGLCSFENPPDEHLSKLAELHDGRPFREGPTIRMTEPELRRALYWVDQHYYFVRLDENTAPDIDTILEKARALVARHGINGFVLDPWGELDNSKAKFVNESSHIAQCLTKIRQFARNHAVHVWIVAHPAKMQRENGKTPPPNLYDIAGSASFFNKADIGLIVHRPEPMSAINGSAVDIIVQKVRFRAVGRPGILRMKFNNINCRYFVPEPDEATPPPSFDRDGDAETLH